MDEQSASFDQMLGQARRGDKAAQGLILEGNRLWLKTTVRRWLPPRMARRQDASDLAQECLVAASRQMEQFRGDDAHTFRNWLRGIQRNLVRRLVRSESERMGRECPLPQSSSEGDCALADPATPVPEIVAHRERMDWLMKAVEALDDDDRRLVQLKYLTPQLPEPTYQELAQRLGCSCVALRQRMSRLLRRLERGIVLLQVMERQAVPVHYRNVLCWQILRGWSVTRIAAELECGERAARTLLEQAQKRMPPDWDQFT